MLSYSKHLDLFYIRPEPATISVADVVDSVSTL